MDMLLFALSKAVIALWALWMVVFILWATIKWRILSTLLWTLGWVSWWITFTYIALHNWGETQDPWTRGWLFDELYHKIFGITLEWNLIYVYRTLFKKGVSPLFGARWSRFLIVMFVTVCIVGALGYVWELIENRWDTDLQPNLFPWLGKAQKGQIDTLIDLALNPCGALIGFIAYCRAERFIYERFYRIQQEEVEIDDLYQEVESHFFEAECLLKKIRAEKRGIIKQRFKKLVARIKNRYDSESREGNKL